MTTLAPNLFLKYVTEYVILSLGIILLAVHYFFYPLSENLQMGFLLAMILIVGVPHGSLDFVVDEQNEIAEKKVFSIKKFVTVYIVRLFVFSLFWLIPWLAFSLFMIFSIYHFGETDMSTVMKPKKTSAYLFISYGSFILGILLLNNLTEIAGSVPAMSNYFTENVLFKLVLQYKTWLMVVLGVNFVVALFREISKGNIEINAHQVLHFSLLMSIISFLPMLLAFTFYFAMWHSIISVRNIFSYFKKVNGTTTYKFICNKSILFSVLALGGLMFIYFILKYFMPETNLLFALLVILSVLTLPHLTVMHGMYKNFNRNATS